MININKTILGFFKNFSWLFSLNILGYLFSFLVLPLLISKYGLKEIGVIFTIQIIVLGISNIANYSLVYYLPTVSKEISEEESKLSHFWNLTLTIRTIISLLLGLFSILIVFFYFNKVFYLWLISLSILLPKIISPTLICNAIEKNSYIFKIGFYSKLFFLISVNLSDSIVLVNFFFAFSEFVVVLYFLPKISSGLMKIQFVGFNKIYAFLKETFNLFLTNFFSHLKTVSILPTITYLIGSEYAALYNIAEKVMNVIRSVSGSVFVSFFPIYNKKKMALEFVSIKNLSIIITLSIIIVFAVWIWSPLIVFYLNNNTENMIAVKTLRVLSLSIPMFFIIIPLFSYLLQFKKWNAILIFSTIQLITLFGFILTYHQNIIQIAMGFVISEYILVTLYYLYVYKQKI